jgi:uridylate kinase
LHPEATRFEDLTYMDVLQKRLKVMDSTAISLCMDNKLPIIVFNLRERGTMAKVIRGEPLGTLVHV